jgi:hypothetical protein
MLMSIGLLPIADAVMGFAIELSLDYTMVASALFLMIFLWCGRSASKV